MSRRCPACGSTDFERGALDEDFDLQDVEFVSETLPMSVETGRQRFQVVALACARCGLISLWVDPVDIYVARMRSHGQTAQDAARSEA